MVIMVTGSRGLTDRAYVGPAFAAGVLELGAALEPGHTLLHGGCRGVDRIAAELAAGWGWQVLEYPADWPRYGRAAGPLRNRRMVEDAQAGVAVWDGRSRGTADAIAQLRRAGRPVCVARLG